MGMAAEMVKKVSEPDKANRICSDGLAWLAGRALWEVDGI